MTYKYITTGSPSYLGSTKNELIDDFQALLNDQFANASTYQSIQEEVIFSSGSFTDVNVRVNIAINSATGEKMGDDWKKILFQDIAHSTGIGFKYFFDDNYWIVVFSETIKNLAASCLVRRCNSRLRWMGTDGTYYEEPCAIEYKVSRPRDSVGTVNPVMPQGFIDIYAQLNSKTKLIKGNQRFLFGPVENRICLKVFGNGIQNMLNQETSDDSTSRLLVMSVGGNFINSETDDIINGIADRYVDFNKITSASNVGIYDIIIVPDIDSIVESGSLVYDVRYYSGSMIHSGSFVFSVSGSNVPVANYTMNTIDGNQFSIINNKKWLSDTLDIIASGSSGSRIMNLELRGVY